MQKERHKKQIARVPGSGVTQPPDPHGKANKKSQEMCVCGCGMRGGGNQATRTSRNSGRAAGRAALGTQADSLWLWISRCVIVGAECPTEDPSGVAL